VLPKLRLGQEKKVSLPNKCPVCGSPVWQKKGEVVLKCSNKNCYAQEKEGLIHFASKKGFAIQGLGDKNIELLLNEGLIKDFVDIFELKVGDLTTLDRFAQRSSEKLITAIEASKKITLSKFIFALGIRYVGEENALILADLIADKDLKAFIDKVTKLSKQNLNDVEGIGEKVATSICEYFSNKSNIKKIERMMELGVTLLPTEKKKNKSGVTGKTFVLTGSLESMSREEAKELIKKYAGKVAESVGPKTDFVVLGANPGSKKTAAEKLKIKIITEEEFKKIFN